MRIEVVTLFPELVEAGVSAGVVGRARTAGILSLGTENPRRHASGVHRSVDDRPFGGGPGMLLAVEPLATAIRCAKERLPAGVRVIGLAAAGASFTQAVAQRLAALPAMVLVAGRYEGIDQRVTETLIDEELSIGDYVLSGGELPALVVIDAVTRLLPGALGDAESAGQDSYVDGLLEGPQFTRPESWEGKRVPEVLQGGNHAAIRRWRLKQALGLTWQRRPELLARRGMTTDERELLAEYCTEAGIEPPR